jgi:hypothetical protein
MLSLVTQSLLSQVDALRVYLNGYDAVPSCLDHPLIEIARSQDHGDKGDAGKFHWADRADGYQFNVERMLAAVRSYDGRAACGVHGSIYRGDHARYYTHRKKFHFTHALDEDTVVHRLGTGTVAYDPEHVGIQPDFFELPNMSDGWFGLFCQQEQIPQVVIARKANWLKALQSDETIFDRYTWDDEERTAVIKRIWPWRLFPVERT